MLREQMQTNLFLRVCGRIGSGFGLDLLQRTDDRKEKLAKICRVKDPWNSSRPMDGYLFCTLVSNDGPLCVLNIIHDVIIVDFYEEEV
jgi:hypothetical protein